jgi:hypothetical protein
MPPSTFIVWPVIKSLSEDARNSIGADDVLRYLDALEGA